MRAQFTGSPSSPPRRVLARPAPRRGVETRAGRALLNDLDRNQNMTTSTFPTLSTPAGPISADAPSWNQQRHSQMPSHRYQDVYSRVPVPLTTRDWPANRLTTAPRWVPVDLRDGNQALAEPMDPARTRRPGTGRGCRRCRGTATRSCTPGSRCRALPVTGPHTG